MQWVIGVDEAGRGPLAGPVAVGIVSVPEGFDVAQEFLGVRDSKKLSEKKREEIFTMLEARAALGDVRFTVEFEDAVTIDEKGIVYAVRTAAWRGIQTEAPETVSMVFLDGLLSAPVSYRQQTIIHGDDLIPIISLASIAAKVMRDRLMNDYDQKFPGYGFAAHKGYGTALHYAALKKLGPCVIHRYSYLHLDQKQV